MSIINDLTPEQYKPISFVVEILPDEELTVDSLVLHTDVRILNDDGKSLGSDHPVAQATGAELSAFLAWILRNLSVYESLTGLIRYICVDE